MFSWNRLILHSYPWFLSMASGGPQGPGAHERENDRARRAKVAEIIPMVVAALEELDSSSDDENVDNYFAVQQLPRAGPRDLPKSRHFFNLIDQMDQTEFHSHFRMSNEAFLYTVSLVEGNRMTPWTHGLTSKQRALIGLWYLGSDSSYRTTSQQFGISISTAHDSVEEFVEALIAAMPTIITLPTEDEIPKNATNFYKYKYPNVYGAIDGTFINVVVPQEHKVDYFTRKHTTSVNLTALCNAEKRYMNISVGFSARCHDSHIFQMSKLGRAIDHLVPRRYHIIGDAAYGLSTSMMCPFPGQNLSELKTRHNDVHSSTRMVVERSFTDLKNRWLRLKSMKCELSLATKIISACCVLHNICIKHGDIAPTASRNCNGNHELIFNDAASKRHAIATHILDH